MPRRYRLPLAVSRDPAAVPLPSLEDPQMKVAKRCPPLIAARGLPQGPMQLDDIRNPSVSWCHHMLAAPVLPRADRRAQHLHQRRVALSIQ